MTRKPSTLSLFLSVLVSLALPGAARAQDFFFSHQIIGKVKLTQISGTGAGLNQVITWDGSKPVWATPPGAGGGEANTASNQGAGVGVFKSKVGVDLGFKSFLAADSKITITGGTNDITFAVVPANFTLSAIGGSLNISQINATGTPGAGNVLVGNGTWAAVGLTSMVTGTLPVANGGTGQTSASAAINALLPSKTSNSLKVLRVNAGETDVEWATAGAGSGDVTQAGTNTMTGYTNFLNGSLRAPETTVASLPAAASNTGKIYIITDGASAGSCASGGGSTVTICRSNGSAWVAVGDGNSAGSTQYQAAGSNVGSPRGTLDFLAGTGINWTVNDTGAKVTTQPAIDTAVVLTRATDQAGTDKYCRSTTGNDTYTCALTPALTTYTRGGCLVLDADTANTGTASLNVDTLGAKSILNRAGSALADGDITANKPITICYDGTQFIIQGDGGAGGSSAFSSLTSGTNTGAAMVVGAGASFRANSADATAPNKSGTSLPGTCTVADTYVKTDATNTAVNYVCTATNTWTQQTGTGAPAPVFDTFANRGTCNAAATGKVFYASDISLKNWICDGSTWKAVLAGQLLTEPPAASNWTSVTGSSAPTVTDVGGAVRFVSNNANGDLSAILRAVPGSTPYNVDATFSFLQGAGSGTYYPNCGIFLANGTTSGSKNIYFSLVDNGPAGTTDLRAALGYYNNYTGSIANALSYRVIGSFIGGTVRVRYRDDGSTRYWELWDGAGWNIVTSETRTTHLTATHFGVGCLSRSSTGPLGTVVLYGWSVN